MAGQKTANGLPGVGPGYVVAKKYKLERELGRGAFGVVFVARQIDLDRLVALKVIRQKYAQDKRARADFLAEARVLARLKHPNIVVIHDVGEDGELLYLVMELLDGESVERRQKRGRIGIASIVTIVRDAAYALDAAHEKGIFHRDVKPENLHLERGVTKLVDFGLALVADGGSVDPSDIAGSPDFLAPEHLDKGVLNELVDIYSLGATAYTLLTGHVLYEGYDALDDLFAAIKNPNVLPPDIRSFDVDGTIPDAIADLVMRMIAFNPEDRPESALEVADALNTWLERHQSEERAHIAVEAALDAIAEYTRLVDERHAWEAWYISTLNDNGASTLTRRKEYETWRDEQRTSQAEAVAAETAYELIQRAKQAGASPTDSDRLAHFFEVAIDVAEEQVNGTAHLRWEHALRFMSPRAHQRRLLSEGVVAFTSRIRAASVILFRLVNRNGIFVPELDCEYEEVPESLALPHGRWLVDIEASGFSRILRPIMVTERPLNIPLAFFTDAQVGGADWVVVQGGSYRCGGDPLAANGWPRRWLDVVTFRMLRHLITSGAYTDFLRAVYEKHGADVVQAFAPSTWKKLKSAPAGCTPPENLRLPVNGISWNDAMTFARWYSVVHLMSRRARDVPFLNAEEFSTWCVANTIPSWQVARLPTEDEWDAAVTTNGLRYPQSNVWLPGRYPSVDACDALPTIGSMSTLESERPGLASSFSGIESLMLLLEFMFRYRGATNANSTTAIIRGAWWQYKHFSLGNREGAGMDQKLHSCGFRLVATLPPGA